jgi:hypothetical protein
LTEQSIKGHAAGILQHEYRTVPVESYCNRSVSPRRIELFSKRAFVLESFQPFRPGILRGGCQHKHLREIVLLPPAIEDRVFILPQWLEDVF